MLWPTAGSVFSIREQAEGALPEPLGPAAFAWGGWLNIGEVEALGTAGVSWRMEDVTNFHSPRSGNSIMAQMQKTLIETRTMQVVMGQDFADPGQLQLWRAGNRMEDHVFRLQFPQIDPVRTRIFTASVTSIEEVYDSANSVMKLQADLLMTSALLRSEDF